MKKALLALPLVASASWAGATYYSSSQSLPEYEKLLASLNKQIGELALPIKLEFESEEYHAGFMNSYAITSLAVAAPDDEESVLLRLKHEISHSPVVINDEGARVGSSEIITTLLTDNIADPEGIEVLNSFEGGVPFVINTRVAVTGKTTTEIVVNKAERYDGENYASFGGAKVVISGDDSDHLVGSGSIGEISSSLNGSNLQMAESSLSFNLAEVAAGVYIGEQAYEIPKISYASDGMQMFLLEGLGFSTVGEQTVEGLLDSNATISVSNIESMFVPLNSLQYSVSLQNMDPDALENYLKVSQNTPFTHEFLSSSEQDSALIKAKLVEYTDDVLEASKKLISEGLGLDMSLNLENEGGKVDAAFGIELLESAENMQTFRDLLTALEGSISVQADEAAVNMVPMAAMMMEQQGMAFFKLENGKYVGDAKLKDLFVSLNGESMSLEGLLGEELSKPLTLENM